MRGIRNGVLLCTALSTTLLTGCIVQIGRGSGWHGSTYWTESVTEEITVNVSELREISIRAHNGTVSFEGLPENSGDVTVVVTKVGGGPSPGSAKAALDALEVYAEPTAGGKLRVGYRWRGIRHSRWQARVDFDVKAPSTVQLDTETHNGSVRVSGITGNALLVTHNGPIEVHASGGSLRAKTHNGRIAATYAGADVNIETHNGSVVADLRECTSVGGRIKTHNGHIEVAVGPHTAADLKAGTHNGGIQSDAPVMVRSVGRNRLDGTIGPGGPPLELTTHNGRIQLKNVAG